MALLPDATQLRPLRDGLSVAPRYRAGYCGCYTASHGLGPALVGVGTAEAVLWLRQRV